MQEVKSLLKSAITLTMESEQLRVCKTSVTFISSLIANTKQYNFNRFTSTTAPDVSLYSTAPTGSDDAERGTEFSAQGQ